MNDALEAAFWANVEKRGPDDCWPWVGPLWPNDYGRFLDRGAHRFAWIFANGPIPDGLHVLHRCDWPPCCNPAHLFLGTHLDNMRDKSAKGRATFGERHHASRLTEAAVREARHLYAQGGVTLRQLADRYGVSREAVGRAVNRVNWSHVR